LSQKLQIENVINSWIPPPTSETLQSPYNDKDSPVKKDIKLCIHQLHHIQHNHEALYTLQNLASYADAKALFIAAKPSFSAISSPL
jgi:hypothetical protein